MRFRDRIQAGYELRNFVDWEDIFQAMTLLRSWNNDFRNRMNGFLNDYDADVAAHVGISPGHGQAVKAGAIRFANALPASLSPPAGGGTWVVVPNLRNLVNYDNGYGFNHQTPNRPQANASRPNPAPPPDRTPLKRFPWPDFRYDSAGHQVTAGRVNGIYLNIYFTNGRMHRPSSTFRTACSPVTYQAILMVLSPRHNAAPPYFNAEGDLRPQLRTATGTIGMDPRFRRLYHGIGGAGTNAAERRETMLAALEEYGLGESAYIRRRNNVVYRPYRGAELRPGDTANCGWRRGGNRISGGHAFYIYAIRYHQNRTWFQILSAQSSSSGVGISGFREDNPGEYAELPDALVNHAPATWYCLEDQQKANSWAAVTAPNLQVNGSMGILMAVRCWRYPRMPVFLPRTWRAGSPRGNRLVEDRWNADPRRVARHYHRNNIQGHAGFFPFGANRVWHGGIHLYPAETDRRVTAVADGRICAVRFEPPDSAPAALNGKSRNFILIRHDLSEYRVASQNGPFFSLYMHLENEDYNATATQREQIWWRGYAERLGLGDRLRNGEVVTFTEDQGIWVQAGDVIGHVSPRHGEIPPPEGHAGPPELAPPTLHFEIFSQNLYFPEECGFRPLVDDDNTACVDRARFADVGAAEGEVLWMLINQNMLPGSRLYESADGRPYPVWSREELAQFYRERRMANWLRTFACKHISEWGDRVDYDDLRNMMRYRHLNRQTMDRAINEARTFIWWNDEVAGAVGLPEDQKVYHYHPLRFLLFLKVQMEKADSEAAAAP